MEILSLVVAVLAVAVGFNLVLTTAVIRRLRTQEQFRAGLRPRLGGPEVGKPAPAVPQLKSERALIAIFATDCGPCERMAPQLASELPALTAAGYQVLVVIGVGEKAPDNYVSLLSSGATVITEPAGTGELQNLFSPGATPALYRIEAGIIRAKGVALDECLPAGAAVA